MSFARSRHSPITAPLKAALSDPKITGALLVAALYFPERLKRMIPAQLQAKSWMTVEGIVRALKVLLGIGLVRKLNYKLSEMTVNNWKADAKFVKSVGVHSLPVPSLFPGTARR